MRSITLAQAASRANPADVSLHLVLGDRYRALGWAIQAREEYRAALAHDPKNPRALSGLDALSGAPTHQHAR